MGAPKQKWTPEEEAALKAGILKHGPGKWRAILKDPQFSRILSLRSNVDLKDKWRNMSVMVNGSGPKERSRVTLKMVDHAPKVNESSVDSIPAQSDEEMVDSLPPPPVSGGSRPSNIPRRSVMRLSNLVLDAINNLRESGGTNKTTIAAYIEEQYWAPPNFRRMLSAKLKHLTATGKLIKVKRKYRLPTSAMPEKKMTHSVRLVEGRQRISPITDWDDDNYLQSQIDLEITKMHRMNPQEAAAAAAEAVAEAEAAVAAAEQAAKEADEAEAEAEAAMAFAAAEWKTIMKGKYPAVDEQEGPSTGLRVDVNESHPCITQREKELVPELLPFNC